MISLIKFVFSFVNIRVSYVSEYEVAFDKFATGGVLEYKDIKKFFESVGHVPSQKEIDDAIELVTKSKSRDHSLKCLIVDDVYYSTKTEELRSRRI